jgi:DNA-binding NarL/FixJ family response regulator
LSADIFLQHNIILNSNSGLIHIGVKRGHLSFIIIPVIILTNLGEEEASDELKDLNIHSYIVKANLTPRQVVERVKSAVNA